MNTKYVCYFVSYSGKVCLRNCRQVEGCCFHKNAKIKFPCIEQGCIKPTHSEFG